MAETEDRKKIELSPTRRSDRLRSRIVRILATASLAATLIGMLAYAAFEYHLGEAPSVSGVAGPHLLPVIPIRLAVFLTLSFILHSKIILPVIQSGKYYSSMTER